MKTITDYLTLRLTLDVSYTLNGTDSRELRAKLEALVTEAMGNGAITGDTTAEVDEHSLNIDANPIATAADVGWTVADVLSVASEGTTDEQAEAWLDRNAGHIQDRLTEKGWEVIENLMLMDDPATLE